MALNTAFQPENLGSPLIDFEFFKIQRHSKTAIVEMLQNFFSQYVNSYKITMPELATLQNTADLEKLFITRDFPYGERKLPLIIVSVKSANEKKMFMGVDNLIGYNLVETSTGRYTTEVYYGAADLSFDLIILAQSPDERSKISELIYMCFTHYYRWQYIYTYADGKQLSIMTANKPLTIGSDQEVADAATKLNMIYLTTLNLTAMVEYTFTALENVGESTDIIIEADSGPDETIVGSSNYIDGEIAL